MMLHDHPPTPPPPPFSSSSILILFNILHIHPPLSTSTSSTSATHSASPLETRPGQQELRDSGGHHACWTVHRMKLSSTLRDACLGKEVATQRMTASHTLASSESLPLPAPTLPTIHHPPSTTHHPPPTTRHHCHRCYSRAGGGGGGET